MDETLNTNVTQSKDVSAFGERDARRVGAAAERIQRAGDFVIIESQNRSLRDHYVKQILSLVFTNHPGLAVRRCKKERDWMIATLNAALEKKQAASDDEGSSNLSEIWVVDLNNSDDFELLKLAQTLVAQFAEGGVCMIVSCSGAVKDHPLFERWAARLAIPVWSFQVPDSGAIRTFLDQEAEAGAVNQARQLVSQLESALPKAPVVLIEDSLLYERQPISKSPEISNPVLDMKTERVVPIKAEKMLASEPESVVFREKLKMASKIKSGTKSIEVKTDFVSRVKLVSFAAILLVVSVGTVSLIINDSAINWVEKKISAIEFPAWAVLSKSIFTDGENLVVGTSPLVKEPKKSAQVSSDLNDADSILKKVNEAVTSIGVNVPHGILKLDQNVKRPVEPQLPVTAQLEMQFGLEDEGHGGGFLNAREQRGSAKVIQKKVNPEPQKLGYFAQLAAFKSKSSANGWRRSRMSVLPATSLVEKKGGLWAVVSGPFDSKEAAERAFSQREIKIYVVEASDLKLGFSGTNKT